MRPDVVVVDPAYKVASIDSNSEREVVDLMRLFDRWRAEYGFAFIMPVHTRKGDKKNPGGQPTLDDIFGSGAFSRLGIDFTDPGLPDVHRETVNFGDGTGDQTSTLTTGDRDVDRAPDR